MRSLSKITIIAGVVSALGLMGAPAAQTLQNFDNLGRVKTGYIEAQGTTAGGDYYTIVGGGGDTWDRHDEMAFAYHEFYGDFDIRVQVTEMEATGIWSKAGISARESLAEDARRVAQTVSPLPVMTTCGGNGANSMEFLWRTGIRDADGENGGNHSASIGSPQYPNQWIRLVRRGNTFTGYAGTDGVNWPQTTSVDSAGFQGGALPQKLYVGLSVSRHPCATKQTCRTVFTNYTERFVDSDQRFCVANVDSRGYPNTVFVQFNRPYGPSALAVENYDFSGGSGQILNAVNPGPDANTVALDVETMDEGATYAAGQLAGYNILDANGNPLGACSTSGTFVHAQGFEKRRIHIQHNKTEGGDPNPIFFISTAYKYGHGAWTEGSPPMEGNTVFEDPMPDGDPNPRNCASRIIGVLQPPADGNYLFACSSDDIGNLYLSTDDQFVNKRLIAREPSWNGRRQYVAGDNQGSRGTPASNISGPQALVGGRAYLLEYAFAEGGGGNNGSVTWDAGTGTAFANGQTPIEEANFVESRFAYGAIFYNLGAAQIIAQPANTPVLPIGQPATFSVGVDGTPPYTFQWRTNGVPVAGANGSTFTIPAVTEAMGRMQVSCCVSNLGGGVCSSDAQVNVYLNPILTSVGSRGNCHAVFLNFNKPMKLEGDFAVLRSNHVNGAVSFVFVTGVSYGRDQKELVLSVAPNLVPTTSTYFVGILDAMSQDDYPLDPSPTFAAFVQGSEFPVAAPADGTPGNLLVSQFQTNTITYRRWLGLNQATNSPDGRGAIPSFMGDDRYLNGTPDQTRTDFTSFETPFTDDSGNYGAELNGFWVVPATGTYTFWCSADDQSITYIATDANPANKVALCREPEWANYRAYLLAHDNANDNRGEPAVNVSAPISLTAGQVVYLQADYIEGGGGDHYALFYSFMRRSPNGCVFTSFCDVFVTQEPADFTAYETLSATFTVAVDGTPSAAAGVCYRYQWYKNGVAIPGATGSSYTAPAVTAANDDGDKYWVVAQNDFSEVKSREAVLSVRTNPLLVSASTRNDPIHLYLTWNRPVALAGVYDVTGPGSPLVNGAAYGASQNEVVLELDSATPMTPGDSYTLTVTDEKNLLDELQESNPTNMVVRQGPPGFFCADFNAALPAGASVYGNAALNADGSVHLTEAVNSQQGSIVFNIGQAPPYVNVEYKQLIGDPTTGMADGFSVSYGNDVANASFGEGGSGTGLIVRFNTYAGWYRGCLLYYKGAELARVAGNFFTTPASYINVSVNLTADGKVSVTHGGATIYDNFQLPNFTPFTGNVKLGFGARTGGENEKNWLDDVCFNNYPLGAMSVVVTPSAPSLTVGATATLTAAVSGSPPVRFGVWAKNGIPIPGATGLIYTTPPATEADNGAVFSFSATNDFSVGVGEATVSVRETAVPVRASTLNAPSTLWVFFNKPVNLDGTYVIDGGEIQILGAPTYGSTESIVVLSTGPIASDAGHNVRISGVTAKSGHPMDVDPTTLDFTQGPGKFCTDFEVHPPANLLLSEEFTTADGGFVVTNIGAPVQPWIYKSETGTWSCWGSAASDDPDASGIFSPPITIPERTGVALTFQHRYSFEFDGTAWDGGMVVLSVNGGPPTLVPLSAFTLNGYNGVIAGDTVLNNLFKGSPGFVNASSGHGTGLFVTSIANLGVFNAGDVISVGFITSWDQCCEGAEPNWEITSYQLARASAASALATYTTYGNAAVGVDAGGVNNVMHLTDAVNGQQGTMVIEFGQPLLDVKARFKMLLGDTSSGSPADGASFSFAPDVEKASYLGEGGSGTGLTVSFNTYSGTYIGCRIFWNRAELARVPYTLIRTPAQFVDTYVELDILGRVTVRYGNDVLFNRVQIPNYTPKTGNARVGFGGRTGGLNQKNWLDDICINDYVLGPASVSMAATTPVQECSGTTLAPTVSGSPPLYYQWLSNGVAVAGANTATLAVPQLMWPGENPTYTLVVSNLFSTASAATVVSVVQDIAGPVGVCAGSLNGNAVEVTFDQAADPVTAVLAANYTVNGGANSIVGPVTLRADGKRVVFNVSPALVGAFTVRVAGVLDACPGRNSTPSVIGSTVLGSDFASTDVGTAGDPNPAGTNFVCGNTVEIVTGGSDTWGNADHNHFVYAPRSGDFDVKLKVTRLDLQSSWTKGGLMARVSTAANSPQIMTYHSPVNGANQIEAGARLTVGGNIADGTTGIDWGIVARPASSANPWIRLQRVGDQFRGYSSGDGVTWNLHADTGARLCGQVPQTMLVGMFVTPNNGNNGNTATGEFQDFSLTPQGYQAPLIASQPASVSGTCGEPVQFQVGVSGPACRGELSYQWFFNYVIIPGATNDTYATTAYPLSAGSYNVVVIDSTGHGIVSEPAVLTVTTGGTAPVAGMDAMGTVQNLAESVPVVKLLANDTGNGTLTLTGVSATSTNGGTVALASGVVTYTPSAGFVGTDAFTYTLTDACGNSAQGMVVVVVRSANLPSANTTVRMVGGKTIVSFAGIPFQAYIIQAAPGIAGPWTNLSPPILAGPNGLASYEDPTDPMPPIRFYRTIAAP
ncbi:MAG: cadherin-like domain-containing protein [Verrucomicrobia bacterium]|nr:cadherin-like domain-containing protein [Verrucomicrobiota bacterium]